MSKFYSMHRYLKDRAAATIFLRDISELEETFFKTHKETPAEKKFKERYELLFKEIDIAQEKDEHFAKVLLEIKQYLTKIDFMHITFAFQPSEKFLSRLQELLIRLIGFPPIFDVEVDANVLGGAVLDYNGKHLDLSFKKTLDTYFAEHKDAILSGV